MAVTPEERREQKRQWAAANPEKVRESARASHRRQYAANPEKVRERNRQWRAANPEKVREGKRQWHAANPGQGLWTRHGMRPEDWSAIWNAQGGRCYLCDDPLPADRRQVHIDHDHDCCPSKRSCAFCRRGLCCGNCNGAIGLAADDPGRLERIAASLRAAQLGVAQRMAGKPVQGMLAIGE